MLKTKVTKPNFSQIHNVSGRDWKQVKTKRTSSDIVHFSDKKANKTSKNDSAKDKMEIRAVEEEFRTLMRKRKGKRKAKKK